MAFPAHGEASELVQQGEGLFHDVAQLAQALDAVGLAFRDDRFGATLAAGSPNRLAVLALVGQQDGDASSGPARTAGLRWEQVE